MYLWVSKQLSATTMLCDMQLLLIRQAWSVLLLAKYLLLSFLHVLLHKPLAKIMHVEASICIIIWVVAQCKTLSGLPECYYKTDYLAKVEKDLLRCFLLLWWLPPQLRIVSSIKVLADPLEFHPKRNIVRNYHTPALFWLQGHHVLYVLYFSRKTINEGQPLNKYICFLLLLFEWLL